MTDFLSIDALILKTEKRISEVPGTSVQTYSEDIIAEFLIEGFEFCAEKAWWPHLMQWIGPISLDGTTGIPTADLQGTIDKFKQIRVITPSDRNRPLPLLPSTINPFLLTGTRALYVEDYKQTNAARVFRVWPLTATNTLYAHVRLMPSSDDYRDQSTILQFDANILANYAAWSMCVDDGTNGGQAQKFEEAFQAGLSAEMVNMNSQPIILDNAMPIDAVDQWFIAGP